MTSPLPVIVIGAGMAGLACARTLAAKSIPVTVLESTDRLGGRLGSEQAGEIWCDRGFQVSMSNYAALESLVPRDVVPRHSFLPGAMVWDGRHRIKVIDPKKSPLAACQPLLRGLVGFRDLLAAQRCRRWARRINEGETQTGTAADVIRQAGFRRRFVETFLRPFFGGVFLDEALDVPADRFLRTLHRFATGEAELPSGSMQQLAQAMAAPIQDHVRLGHEVISVKPGDHVKCSQGEAFPAERIVLATTFEQSVRLLGRSLDAHAMGWSGTMACHFTTPQPVLQAPLIVLNGSGTGMINLICSPSGVAPGYGPEDTHTLLVSLRPYRGGPPQVDVEAVQAEAAAMLGVDASAWSWVRNSVVSRALPRISEGHALADLPKGIWIAGDWKEDPSIEEAVQSGIDVANDIINQGPQPTT
ncbi:MAG: hypothetical protein CMJ29_11750 [Phycisphaerae bacterium]|nr:hypothetical protein [Phycisphaerae bacterium]